jgi:hypothetical protein
MRDIGTPRLMNAMECVSWFGQMVQFMKDTGKTTKLMVVVDLFMQIVMFILVIGSMIRLTDMVFTFTLMEQNTKDNGTTINNKARERNHGKMVLFSRVTILKVRKKDLDISNGQMAVTIRVNSRITIFMVEVTTDGLTAELTKVSGNSIKCTELEFSPGMMVVDMRVNTTTTRNKVQVYSFGQMAESTMEAGSMVNNTDMDNTSQAVERLSLANGKMERELNGLQKMNIET